MTIGQSYLKPGPVERIFGRLLTSFVRIGLIHGHFYVLEVRGQTSGRSISLPVAALLPGTEGVAG